MLEPGRPPRLKPSPTGQASDKRLRLGTSRGRPNPRGRSVPSARAAKRLENRRFPTSTGCPARPTNQPKNAEPPEAVPRPFAEARSLAAVLSARGTLPNPLLDNSSLNTRGSSPNISRDGFATPCRTNEWLDEKLLKTTRAANFHNALSYSFSPSAPQELQVNLFQISRSSFKV
jgi:hypothetical protein